MSRNKNRIIGWLRVCVLALFCPAFLWRCANIMKLEGGPKDTIPPVVVGALPEDYTVNYPTLNGPNWQKRKPALP